MKADNATHWLSCTHSLNSRSKIHYRMPCHILKTMPDGRLKVLVFGERYRGSLDKSRTRYVPAYRVAVREGQQS